MTGCLPVSPSHRAVARPARREAARARRRRAGLRNLFCKCQCCPTTVLGPTAFLVGAGPAVLFQFVYPTTSPSLVSRCEWLRRGSFAECSEGTPQLQLRGLPFQHTTQVVHTTVTLYTISGPISRGISGFPMLTICKWWISRPIPTFLSCNIGLLSFHRSGCSPMSGRYPDAEIPDIGTDMGGEGTDR